MDERMAHGEAHAWWADVQHLRDDYERTAEARRRADQADFAADRGPTSSRRPAAPAARRPAPAATRPATPPARRSGISPERRTIEIRGRTVPAPPVTSDVVQYDRRRPMRAPSERIGSRPDRMALWALLMGIVLILAAVGTADAATVASVAGH